ncbi:MAG: TlpA disulfide reductase family protein [Gammaproteobacteria bacterium]
MNTVPSHRKTVRRTIGIFLLGLATTLNAASMKQTAPDFTLKSNGGNNIKLSELRGEVVMINFWATWCGPCRQEMPVLESLYQEYQDLGFTILGVNVEEDSSKAAAMMKDLKINFPILFDTSSKASKLYDVSSMPSTVLVDRDGNIRYVHRGYKSGYEDKYQVQIRELIRE